MHPLDSPQRKKNKKKNKKKQKSQLARYKHLICSQQHPGPLPHPIDEPFTSRSQKKRILWVVDQYEAMLSRKEYAEQHIVIQEGDCQVVGVPVREIPGLFSAARCTILVRCINLPVYRQMHRLQCSSGTTVASA